MIVAQDILLLSPYATYIPLRKPTMIPINTLKTYSGTMFNALEYLLSINKLNANGVANKITNPSVPKIRTI